MCDNYNIIKKIDCNLLYSSILLFFYKILTPKLSIRQQIRVLFLIYDSFLLFFIVCDIYMIDNKKYVYTLCFMIN